MSYTGTTPKFDSVEGDNIKVDGNTISSTNADGDINLLPDGAGKVTVPTRSPGDDSTAAASTEYVDDAIAAIPPVDLTGYATEEYVDEKIAENSGGGGGGTIQFKLNGSLSVLTSRALAKSPLAHRLDGVVVSKTVQYERVRMSLNKNGISGQTVVDIKRHLRVSHPIKSIAYQMEFNSQSVGRVGSPLDTQSISLKTPAINTLEIVREKTQQNVASIISLGGNLWRLNLEGSSLDSDWKKGAKILIASATNADNNGEREIEEVNQDGYPSITFYSVTGVQELSSPAVVDLQFFKYVFASPVEVSGFKVGEQATFAGHTASANNGQFEIVRINDSGNNILVYNNQVGATTQGSASGTVQCSRWVYTFSAAVDETAYYVGETLTASTHSNAANNGVFVIRAVNESGNNLVVTNLSGVSQAGAAGNTNTNRWVYSVLSDPANDIDVGDMIFALNHSSAGNNGAFQIKELKRFDLFNIVIFNEAGVVQASAAGSLRSEKMVISFDSDFSESYQAGVSLVTAKNTSNILNSGEYFEVVEINRGGGIAYNIVIKNTYALSETASLEQDFPMGKIDFESRSLFTTLPQLGSGDSPKSSGADAVFRTMIVPSGALVALDVLEVTVGRPFDLLVELS